ncbi:MAG: hypothetical protein QS721_07285 [Candidatus Endonucleobacter sp. (ex Gigantidas childressi)]|nr:hypothetical protein [Candidatus Endonucleobacter sp. (ex Gigantidas childressi)]
MIEAHWLTVMGDWGDWKQCSNLMPLRMGIASKSGPDDLEWSCVMGLLFLHLYVLWVFSANWLVAERHFLVDYLNIVIKC